MRPCKRTTPAVELAMALIPTRRWLSVPQRCAPIPPGAGVTCDVECHHRRDFARLAHEAALRALDKQERVLEELRARTGMLLAASSLAAAFLGQEAFRRPEPAWLVIVALVAFVAVILACVYILVPTSELVFAESGVGLTRACTRSVAISPRCTGAWPTSWTACGKRTT